jgi:hypothetical protein
MSEKAFGAGAKAISRLIRATPIITCADTGDMVVTRVDSYPTTEGQKTDVCYWYIPAQATGVHDIVRLDISELASGFFKKPINPFTWDPIIPTNKR